MCTFMFAYADGNDIKCEHVTSACYGSGDRASISEQNLATHKFPIEKDLWLFTKDGSFCVNHDGLRFIKVVTE